MSAPPTPASSAPEGTKSGTASDEDLRTSSGLPPHDIAHYMRPGTLQLPALPPLALYIHIPWCLRKCPYCDFNSHAWHPGRPTTAPTSAPPVQATAHSGLPQEQRYLDALTADLEASLPLIWGRSVRSIFIGGGTPSLFSPAAVDDLLSRLRARLRLEPDCEITLEANPGTFERARFRAYRQAGVTRLSIGVQSFDDRFLTALGRVHTGQQAHAAVQEAAEAFDTFNIDLMYALPGQSLDDLERDLRTALALRPPHLSIYHLTIEPNTLFARHPPPLPEEDTAWDMLDRITAMTQAAGLQRYEISAYARGTEHRCLHNLNYWEFGDYLGIGAGAHGKLSFAHRIVRQVRVRDPQRYMDAALDGRAIASEHSVRRKDLPFEFMLGALRLREGFAMQDYTDRTGLPASTITATLEQAQRKGLLDIVPPDTPPLPHPAAASAPAPALPARIRPTARGMDFLSDVQAMFLADEA